MKKKYCNTIKICLFFAVLAFVLYYLGRSYTTAVLCEGRKGYRVFDQSENSFDIFYLGNCHSYSTFIPSLIEEKTGLRGFDVGASDLSGTNAPVLLKLAMKNQKISVLVLESFPFLIDESYCKKSQVDAYEHALISELPFSTRFTVLSDMKKGVKDLFWLYYIFDVGYFHERWTTNTKFGYVRSAVDNGWIEYWNIEPLQNPDDLLSFPVTLKTKNLNESYLNGLLEILEYAKRNGIKVIFTTIPYTERDETDIEKLNTLKKIISDYGIDEIDFTSPEMIEKLHLTRSLMIDKNHVNAEGAKIISTYMADYLANNGFSINVQ